MLLLFLSKTLKDWRQKQPEQSVDARRYLWVLGFADDDVMFGIPPSGETVQKKNG